MDEVKPPPPVMPSDEIMRNLTRMSMIAAMETIAKQADDMAKELPPGISGPQALRAFAAAMRSNTNKQWPTKGRG